MPSQQSEPALAPIRDAASMLIVREGRSPRVLMGKRSARHKFMPSKYVFPGGRVDPADSRLKLTPQNKMPPPMQRRLQIQSRLNGARTQALALAAIRETFEETGLIIGKPARTTRAPLQSRHPIWRTLLASGAEPRLARLEILGRAITPPNRVRRYDTRFFIANAEEMMPADPAHRPSGELLHLDWMRLADAARLELPIITRYMLHLLEQRLAQPRARRASEPAWFFRELGGRPRVEHF